MTQPDKLYSPPICAVCGIDAGGYHKKGCAALAAMRAQAYPEVLDDNGMPWYTNEIERLQKQLADIMCENEENCRLLGISAERELKLISVIQNLEPLRDIDWHGKWRIYRALEAIQSNKPSLPENPWQHGEEYVEPYQPKTTEK